MAPFAPTMPPPAAVTAAPVRHLRAQGAFLYKRSTHQHLTLVSAKGEVEEIPYDRVTEAFGAENWPHLLHMLEDGDSTLRKRVLMAMTSVFKLPQELAMCLKHGALEMVEHNILDANADTAELAAHVFSVMLESAASRSEVMKSETVEHILPVFKAASSPRMMQYLYDAFITLTRTFIGAQLLSRSGYMVVVIEHLKRSNLSTELRFRVLCLLRNLVNDGIEGTSFKAIDLECVELSAKYLYDSSRELRVASCDTIAALAYVDKAKKIAVEKGVIKKLCTLLTDSHWQVAAASAGALMTLAVHDEAKRAIVSCDGLQTINQLLQSPKRLVQLNTAKLVAAMASYPVARQLLNVSSTEYHLRSLMAEDDALLVRSARIALHAVQWQP